MFTNLLFQHFFMPLVILVVACILPQCKNIGPVGYRTPRSMKNQENWDFAQKLSGRLLLIFGLILLLLNVLFYFALLPEVNYPMVEKVFIGGGLLALIIYVEFRLYQVEKKE